MCATPDVIGEHLHAVRLVQVLVGGLPLQFRRHLAPRGISLRRGGTQWSLALGAIRYAQ